MSSMEKKFQQFQPESPPRTQAHVALWIRLTAAAAALLVGFLLYRLPGGFPPPVWLSLVALVRSGQASPGPALLVPALQSGALLVAWVLLLVIALRVVHLWRFDPRQQLSQPPQVVMQTTRPQEGARDMVNGQAFDHASGSSASLLQDERHVIAAAHSPSLEETRVGVAAPPQESAAQAATETCGALWPCLLTLLAASTFPEAFGSMKLPMDGSPAHTPFLLAQEQGEGMGLTVSASCHQPDPGSASDALQDALFCAAGLYLGAAPQGSYAPLLPLGLFLLSDGFTYRQANACVSTGQVTVQAGAHALLPLLAGNPPTHGAEAVGRGVLDAIQLANTTLYQRLVQMEAGEAERVGGTSLAALLVIGTTAYVASVGNSRAYLFRASEGLVQVTYDHAPAPDLGGQGAGDGLAAQEEAEPLAAVAASTNTRLYRSLGEHEQVEPDLFALQLEAGDLLLLCSDGLWSRVDRDTIEQTLRRFAQLPVADAVHCCAALCEHASAGEGSDPFSLIVVQTIAIKAPASRRKDMRVLDPARTDGKAGVNRP